MHDWFSHGKNVPEEPFELELADDDPWTDRPMRIERTRSDPHPDANGGAPTYVTADSHWWDGSQIYGSEPALSAALRSNEGGKLRLDPDGQLPRDLEEMVDLTGVAGNFWLGLALLHTLFTHEHNAICDRLQREYPSWSDDELYDRARLINAALMAKIHTVEWTPAIIAHPTTKYAMRANWYGILGKRLRQAQLERGPRRHPRLAHRPPRRPLLADRGVRRRLPDAPAAARRLHLPVDRDGRGAAGADVPRSSARSTRAPGSTRSASSTRSTRSGSRIRARSCCTTTRASCRSSEKPDGTVVDLAATDVLRIRERGVPRYNDFRRLFHLKPAATFEELTDNPQWAKELREVYGDVERVDLMVGLYAERLPKGFGFSDTAFRVFILMASRRLKSDRFFTRDYNAETYTQAGLDWIDDTTMIDVLKRHYPELAPALEGVDNAFAPWRRTGTTTV